MQSLTDTDIKNLSNLPSGWFESSDIWPAVKRTNYSLARLIEAGYVEKGIGAGSIYDIKYRKIKDLNSVNLFIPQRIQRKRIKGWKMPDNIIYVGRQNDGEFNNGEFGNPFRVGDFIKIGKG